VLGEGAIAEFAIAEGSITPAPTARGRAAQFAMLRSELTPRQLEKWGPFLDTVIDKHRRAGRPSKAGEAVQAWLENKGISPGVELSRNQMRDLRHDTGASDRTIKRVLKQRQK
jgi:hypothetical protein